MNTNIATSTGAFLLAGSCGTDARSQDSVILSVKHVLGARGFRPGAQRRSASICRLATYFAFALLFFGILPNACADHPMTLIVHGTTERDHDWYQPGHWETLFEVPVPPGDPAASHWTEEGDFHKYLRLGPDGVSIFELPPGRWGALQTQDSVGFRRQRDGDVGPLVRTRVEPSEERRLTGVSVQPGSARSGRPSDGQVEDALRQLPDRNPDPAVLARREHRPADVAHECTTAGLVQTDNPPPRSQPGRGVSQIAAARRRADEHSPHRERGGEQDAS